MTKSNKKYGFNFSRLTKSCKRNKPPLSLAFHASETDQSLCVVFRLYDYLKRTEPWRSDGRNQLLFTTPGSSKSKIAEWVKEVVKLSAIEMSIFRAHSTRSPPPSKVGLCGLSFDKIIKRGNWSNKRTWQQHFTIIQCMWQFWRNCFERYALNRERWLPVCMQWIWENSKFTNSIRGRSPWQETQIP